MTNHDIRKQFKNLGFSEKAIKKFIEYSISYLEIGLIIGVPMIYLRQLNDNPPPRLIFFIKEKIKAINEFIDKSYFLPKNRIDFINWCQSKIYFVNIIAEDDEDEKSPFPAKLRAILEKNEC